MGRTVPGLDPGELLLVGIRVPFAHTTGSTLVGQVPTYAVLLQNEYVPLCAHFLEYLRPDRHRDLTNMRLLEQHHVGP